MTVTTVESEETTKRSVNRLIFVDCWEVLARRSPCALLYGPVSDDLAASSKVLKNRFHDQGNTAPQGAGKGPVHKDSNPAHSEFLRLRAWLTTIGKGR